MRRMVIGFLVSAVINGAAAAQQPETQSSSLVTMEGNKPVTEAPCDYDKCALRLTLGLGSWKLVQGADAKKIGELGYFSGPNIERFVRDDPKAVETARQFRSSYRVSSGLVWGGGLIATGGVGFATANNGSHAAIGVGVTGLAILAYGVWRHGKSFDLLSQTVWLYNRSLKR